MKLLRAIEKPTHFLVYDGDGDPRPVAKSGLGGATLARLRAASVRDDAAVRLNEGDGAEEAQISKMEEQVAQLRAQADELESVDPAQMSPLAQANLADMRARAPAMSVMEPVSDAPVDPGASLDGGMSVPPVESLDPSLDVSMPPPAPVFRSLLNTEAAQSQPLGGVPQTGAGPFQTQHAAPALAASGDPAFAPVNVQAPTQADIDASIRAKFGAGGGSVGMGATRMEQYRPDPRVEQALADQQAVIGLQAKVAQEGKLLEADMMADRDRAVAFLDQQEKQRIAENQRAQAQLQADIASGKEDPDRLFHNMGDAQRAANFVGIILGGLGQTLVGGTNPALVAIERAVDRDIEAQRRDLNRKETRLNTLMKQGYDLQQAWGIERGRLLTTYAGMMKQASLRFGASDPAMQASVAASIADLNLKAAQANAAAEADFKKMATQRFEAVSQDRYRRAQVALQSQAQQAAQLAVQLKARMGPGAGKVPPMEIAPGVVVQPADATSRQNLEKAVDAFNTMRNLIVEARAHRAEHGAQLIPRTDAYVKANRLEKQLITALNNVENLGAFDKGTADLLGQIVPTVGGVYTPGVVDSSLADLLKLATQKFQTKVMTNVVPGTGLVEFTGAQSDFKPVGKAD